MRDSRTRLIALLVVSTAALALAGCSGSSTPTNSSSKGINSACPTPLSSATMSIKPDAIYLNVYNASGKSGLASTAANELKWRGFHVISEGNDPNPDNLAEPKWAQVRYGSNGKQVALTVAAQVQNASLHQDKRVDPSVDLVIGPDFQFVPVPPPAASAVTVNVYNTTYRAGLASTVADELKARGFKIGKLGNDPQGAFLPNDVVVVRYGSHGEPAARRAAAQFPNAQLKSSGGISDNTVDVVIGNKYQNLVPTASATPSAWTQKPPAGC